MVWLLIGCIHVLKNLFLVSKVICVSISLMKEFVKTWCLITENRAHHQCEQWIHRANSNAILFTKGSIPILCSLQRTISSFYLIYTRQYPESLLITQGSILILYIQQYSDSILLTITKICLYNVDLLKPNFYMVKLGFTGLSIIFLISAQKHRLWVLVRTASPFCFLFSEHFHFLVVKVSVYLNRFVFLMHRAISWFFT